MENIGRIIKKPETRKYLYGVIITLIPLLVLWGVISDTEASLYITTAGAVLGVGALTVASVNVPTDKAIEAVEQAQSDDEALGE